MKFMNTQSLSGRLGLQLLTSHVCFHRQKLESSKRLEVFVFTCQYFADESSADSGMIELQDIILSCCTNRSKTVH
jgi:hypothetical protein